MNLRTASTVTDSKSPVAVYGAPVAAPFDPRSSSPPRPHRSAVQWPQPIPHVKLIAFLDTAAAATALLLVLLETNLGQMPRGIETFLSMRVTLKNVLLLAGFLAVWSPLFRTVGLYDAR